MARESLTLGSRYPDAPASITADLADWTRFCVETGTGTFSNALHIAVIEIDPNTGANTILRYVVIDNCGTVINPTIVHGQIVGGTIQGIGGAIAPGACLANAVSDALSPLGVTANQTPLTPEFVLRLIQQRSLSGL